jgi:glycosyltransferase involved in cell wall biosynthesis
VSDSTKKDLMRLGWKDKNIFVLPNTLDMKVPDISGIQKEKTLLFYARLTPMKRVEDAIRAYHFVQKELPEYTLRIIGPKQEKSYVDGLIKLSQDL